jgi:hypothetical protein
MPSLAELLKAKNANLSPQLKAAADNAIADQAQQQPQQQPASDPAPGEAQRDPAAAAQGGQAADTALSRQLGDRFKRGDDPHQQLEEITAAQAAARAGGMPNAIESTGKSEQRADHALDQLTWPDRPPPAKPTRP